jgi:hypothetical protein
MCANRSPSPARSSCAAGPGAAISTIGRTASPPSAGPGCRWFATTSCRWWIGRAPTSCSACRAGVSRCVSTSSISLPMTFSCCAGLGRRATMRRNSSTLRNRAWPRWTRPRRLDWRPPSLRACRAARTAIAGGHPRPHRRVRQNWRRRIARQSPGLSRRGCAGGGGGRRAPGDPSR